MKQKTNQLKSIRSLTTKIIFLSLINYSSFYGGSSDLGEEILIEQNTSEEIPNPALSSFSQKPFHLTEAPAPHLQKNFFKNSFLTVGLSLLAPGLGHVYLGDMKTAGGLFGTVGLAAGTISISPADPFIFSNSALTIQTTWLYGLYAAYRDVRIHNGQVGYTYKMPTDNLVDLISAPFSWSVIKKTEVWGGLLGSFAIAVTATYFAFSDQSFTASSIPLKRIFSPLAALPVGIGEESFCRGFLQSIFSEALTPWGGIFLSSLIFGALHIPNAWDMEPQDRRPYYTVVVPLLTLSGVYDGWLTYKNCSLRESVALHTLYDFTLFSLSALFGQSTLKERSNFAIAFPF